MDQIAGRDTGPSPFGAIRAASCTTLRDTIRPRAFLRRVIPSWAAIAFVYWQSESD